MFGRPEEFKEKLAHFNEDAYKGDDFVDWSLTRFAFSFISFELERWMEREFDLEEVTKALEECEETKHLD